MKGRSIRVDDLEQMLDASYATNRPDIDGFVLDKEISSPSVAVYAKDGKAKIIVRGTDQADLAEHGDDTARARLEPRRRGQGRCLPARSG